jgi:hypothetical protein
LDEISVENHKNEVRERVEVRDDMRDSVLPDADGRPEPGSREDDSFSATTTRDLAVRGLAALGVALWFVSVLAIGVDFGRVRVGMDMDLRLRDGGACVVPLAGGSAPDA